MCSVALSEAGDRGDQCSRSLGAQNPERDAAVHEILLSRAAAIDVVALARGDDVHGPLGHVLHPGRLDRRGRRALAADGPDLFDELPEGILLA